MIQLCNTIASQQPERYNAEALTGWGTLALAIITIGLAILAYIQQTDVKKFIRRYTKVSKAQSSENTIIKQLEFHHKLVDRIYAYNGLGLYVV